MKYYVNCLLVIVVIIILIPLLIVKSYNVERKLPPGILKPVKSQLKLTVFNKDQNIIQSMDLEEYIKGVVAAEMPAEFDIEALKAQAVAARTYTYSKYLNHIKTNSDKYNGADVSTDFKDCQAWLSKDDALSKWKKDMKAIYWNKICRAVDETKGIIITYRSNVINAVFHANSGGATENSEDVWVGQAEPYLRSVESNGEDLSPTYKTTISIVPKDFISTMQKQYPEIKLNEKDVLKDIQIVGYTTGGRVEKIRIGNKVINGTELRTIFELRSTNFTLSKSSNGAVNITCQGYGHGVGLSQWGANSMAQTGNKYYEILKHYYTGISLDTITNYQRKTLP